MISVVLKIRLLIHALKAKSVRLAGNEWVVDIFKAIKFMGQDTSIYEKVILSVFKGDFHFLIIQHTARCPPFHFVYQSIMTM